MEQQLKVNWILRVVLLTLLMVLAKGPVMAKSRSEKHQARTPAVALNRIENPFLLPTILKQSQSAAGSSLLDKLSRRKA